VFSYNGQSPSPEHCCNHSRAPQKANSQAQPLLYQSRPLVVEEAEHPAAHVLDLLQRARQ
jgi:hypothetical protein